MRKSIILAPLLLLAILPAGAQSLFFPKMWLGHWKGSLVMNDKEGKTQAVDMQLILEKTENPDEYSFTIVYGNEGGREDVRHYTLVADTAQGHYLMDEGNGIRISERLFSTTLISQFMVQGKLLTAMYAFEREQIRFRILTSSSVPAGKTGGKNTPEVYNFDLLNYQEALLQRVQEGLPKK